MKLISKSLALLSLVSLFSLPLHGMNNQSWHNKISYNFCTSIIDMIATINLNFSFFLYHTLKKDHREIYKKKIQNRLNSAEKNLPENNTTNHCSNEGSLSFYKQQTHVNYLRKLNTALTNYKPVRYRKIECFNSKKLILNF